MIISIHVEKAPDKFQHTFLLKKKKKKNSTKSYKIVLQGENFLKYQMQDKHTHSCHFYSV